ncbi:MAG TPA: transposase [Burkholderiales bacterium]|nr:transposase [Burkholderiales bacterium]
MARPLRLEFSGALYHVTARGDRQGDIFLSEKDRDDWLDLLGDICTRFNWVVHAFCQMTNHYHLLVETIDGNLSRGMQQLNGIYTQRVNRRHSLVGHLFQGRYKAILVQKESYLLELSRYVILNPIRARMVESLEEWQWSSYRSIMGLAPVPSWLDTDWLLSRFGTERDDARQRYYQFVKAGKGLPSPIRNARHQLLLGDDTFVAHFQQPNKPDALREVSKAQRKAVALSLTEYQKHYPVRNEAIAQAYLSGAYTMTEIADGFNIHYMTVSRALRQFEGMKNKSK